MGDLIETDGKVVLFFFFLLNNIETEYCFFFLVNATYKQK